LLPPQLLGYSNADPRNARVPREKFLMTLNRICNWSKWIIVALAAILPCDRLLGQTANLSLSSATTSSGGTVLLNLSLSAPGTPLAGLEWTLAYPSGQILAIAAGAGSAATAAGKSIYCGPASGSFTCLLTGLNATTMTAGVAATVQLTLAPTASTTAITITNPVGVDATGAGQPVSAGTNAVVIVPTISSLACNPGNLNPNAFATCTLTLNTGAPAGGSAITLASNNASLSVPASVTVAAGSTTATFSATAAATIASNQSATVTASLGSSSQTASISLVALLLVSGVTCSPTSLGQSAVSTCTVTLSQTASVGGSTVTLASNNASLSVPASVTIAAGSTTATFSATAAATIASNQSVTVTNTLGSSSQTASVSLIAPVVVSNLACNPTSLGPSSVSTCTVTLTQAPPAGGLAVTLASNNASLSVPTSVTVASGSSTASFSATAAVTIAGNQSASVTASLGSSSQPATPVTQSFTISQGSQTITFGALSNVGFGTSPFTVTASASSGLPVSFASTSPAACTMNGATVAIIAAGTCSITASQAGNGSYLPATSVTQNFTVLANAASQVITFAALSNVALGTASFTISATASSDLTVSFASTTLAVCTVSGTTVNIIDAGTCPITASQAGNTLFSAAPSVTQSFTVGAAGLANFSEPGIFRASGGPGIFWLDLNQSTYSYDSTAKSTFFGSPGDQPVAGDWTARE
jgi:trimeric autotransporter adhesin